MKYFVKNKKVHKYPVPRQCRVHYTGQKQYTTAPKSYEKCDHCFRLPR